MGLKKLRCDVPCGTTQSYFHPTMIKHGVIGHNSHGQVSIKHGKIANYNSPNRVWGGNSLLTTAIPNKFICVIVKP
jgi:hypothetical protein